MLYFQVSTVRVVGDIHRSAAVKRGSITDTTIASLNNVLCVSQGLEPTDFTLIRTLIKQPQEGRGQSVEPVNPRLLLCIEAEVRACHDRSVQGLPS